MSFGAPELIVPLAITLLAPFNAGKRDDIVGRLCIGPLREIFGEFCPSI